MQSFYLHKGTSWGFFVNVCKIKPVESILTIQNCLKELLFFLAWVLVNSVYDICLNVFLADCRYTTIKISYVYLNF